MIGENAKLELHPDQNPNTHTEEYYQTFLESRSPFDEKWLPYSLHMNTHTHSEPRFEIRPDAKKHMQFIWFPDYLPEQAHITIRFHYSINKYGSMWNQN